MIFKYFVILFITTCSMTLPLFASDLEDLDQLLAEKEYHTVLEKIFPHAKAGDVDAQLLLAKMYYEVKAWRNTITKHLIGYVAPLKLIISKRIKLELK